MNYIAFDPSFSRTGCVVVKDKEVKFYTFSNSIGDKNFENIYRKADELVLNISQVISEEFGDSDYIAVSEHPLPQASMSSALFCLDTLLFKLLGDHLKQSYHPTMLKRIHHNAKYSKTDSVNLAMKKLGVLRSNGYEVPKKKPCHDCCEAFLYLCHFLETSGNPDFVFGG